MKKYNQVYYKKNKKKLRLKVKEWARKNKQKIRLQKREYSRRDYVKEKAKRYYNKPDVKKKRIKRLKKYTSSKKFKERSKQKEDTFEYKAVRKAYRKIPEVQMKIRLRARVYNALKYYTKTGKIMSSKKYGVDYKNIIEYLKPFPKNLSKYHIDHIKPLCSFNFINKGGSTNLEEIKKAFAPENHQFLLAEENLKKSGRY